MKTKIATIALIIAASLTGCKKDYTCSCTTTTSPYTPAIENTTSVVLGKMKYDQAVTACTAVRSEANLENNGYLTYSVSASTQCVLN